MNVQPAMLLVHVLGPDRQPLPQATVTVRPSSGGEGHRAIFDESRNAFRLDMVPDGEFAITASADGLEMQTVNVVRIPDEGYVRIVLGRPGDWYLYRDGARTPYHAPDPTLVGILLRAGATDEFRKMPAASGITIEREIGGKMLIGRLARPLEERDSEVLRRLRNNPMVLGAGPVLGIPAEHASILSNTFTVRFRPDISIPEQEHLLKEQGISSIRRVSGAGLHVTADAGVGIGIQEIMERLVSLGAEYVSADVIGLMQPENRGNIPRE